MNQLQETIADIKNKLQTMKTALEVIVQGKNVPKEFAEMALKDHETAVKLLDGIDE